MNGNFWTTFINIKSFLQGFKLVSFYNNVYTKRSVGQYVYHSICILLCVCLYGRPNMNKSKSENAVSDHTEHVSHETPRRSHSVSTANDNVNFNANGKHVKTAKQSECNHKWRAPWKNWTSSTSMKLRKSLVKPVTWQNIWSCLVLSPEIVMHDALDVILWTSADICVAVHDDLGWKTKQLD